MIPLSELERRRLVASCKRKMEEVANDVFRILRHRILRQCDEVNIFPLDYAYSIA